MALAESNTNDLASLFKEGYFKIPNYQRKYSWEKKQIDDLFYDLYEGFQTNTEHFLGTLSLHKTKDKGLQTFYDIIDGQQRFTSIIIFYSELANRVKDKSFIEALKIQGRYILEPIDTKEKDFFYALLNGDKITPQTRSQKLMIEAKKRFKQRIDVNDFKNRDLENFIIYILNKVHFLIYLVEEISEAIRMFEIINDRGLPLKYFDKVKSYFMYYSNKYLGNTLNPLIENTLKEIYKFFDDDKIVIGVNNDDTLLLHHYLSNPSLFKNWSYTKATDLIYQDIKNYLTELAQTDVKKGKLFIKEYLEDITTFIKAVYSIETKITKDDLFEEFFLYLNPEKRMYPLSIRLEIKGIMDDTIKLLEIVEFHLKHRKNPKKDIFNLLSIIIDFSGSKKDLLKTINNHMYKIWADQAYVSDLIINADWASKYVLYKYNKIQYKQKLKYEEYKKTEIEHIFAQEPSFKIREFGFNSKKKYEELNNRIGNLSLLEKSINIIASNKVPDEKIKEYYSKSKIEITKKIRVKNKKDIEDRTKEIEDFADKYFEINEL